MLEVALWLLILGIVGAGLYLAPTSTTLGLVLAGIGMPAGWAVWNYPVLGLLAIIFLTASFVPPDLIDVRLPIGGLDLRDLALFGVLGLLVVRRLIQKRLVVPWWPVSGPLLIFMGSAVFSALYALLYKGVEMNWAMAELRSLSYYAVFFVVAWAITERKDLVVLLAGLYILADITATIVIAQQFFGKSNPLLAAMIGGDWRLWRTEGATAGLGAVRIIPPGHVLIYILTVIAFYLALFDRQKPTVRMFFALQFVYLNLGLLFTYTRAQWIASAIALGLITILMSPADKARLVRYALVIIVLTTLVYGVFGTQLQATLKDTLLINSLTARVLSIFTPGETLNSLSLEWRFYENEEAIRSIRQYPFLGVGLGNIYREITTVQSWSLGGSQRFTRYVHSSYLNLAVKMGIPGTMAFLGFCLAFLINGWKLHRRLADGQLKRMTLAILGSFVSLMGWSLFHSHFLEDESTILVGLMFGMVAGIRNISGASVDANG